MRKKVELYLCSAVMTLIVVVLNACVAEETKSDLSGTKTAYNRIADEQFINASVLSGIDNWTSMENFGFSGQESFLPRETSTQADFIWGESSSCSPTLSGYINAGVLANTRGYKSNGYTNYYNESTGMLNGLYMALEKPLQYSPSQLQYGYGADFMFGYDARFMQTYYGWDESWVTGHDRWGNQSYGFAMPQLYVDLGYGDWSIRSGHFYGLLGYESWKAPERFFYTMSIASQTVPVTNTGVLVNYNGLEYMDFTVGWINGWSNGFSMHNSDSMVTSRVRVRPTSWLEVTYGLLAGNVYKTAAMSSFGNHWYDGQLGGNFPAGSDRAYGSLNELIVELQLTRSLKYVLLMNYGDYTSRPSLSVIPPVTSYRSALLNYRLFSNELFYQFNENWQLGLRVEYWEGNMHTYRFSDNHMYNGKGRISTVTLGLNWSPGSNRLKIRPEIRYQHVSEPAFGKTITDYTRKELICLGMDVVYVF